MLFGILNSDTAVAEGLPEAPSGFAYIVNADGAFILNADGAYILAKV